MTNREDAPWPALRQKHSAFVCDVRAEGPAQAVIHNIGMSEWHVGCEETNNVELVVGSLSNKNTLHCYVCFDEEGKEFLDTRHETPRARYGASRDHSETVSSRCYRQVASDWYVFTERSWLIKPVSIDENRRHVGDAVRGDGIVLTHSEDDGITGEMVLVRYTGLECPEQPGLPPNYTIELEKWVDRHDRLLECYCEGDFEGILRYVTPSYRMIARNYYSKGDHAVEVKGAANLREHIQEFLDGVDVLGVTILNRLITEWYIFAELDWRVKIKKPPKTHALQPEGLKPGDIAHFRTTRVHRIQSDGRMTGEIGYGTPITAVK